MWGLVYYAKIHHDSLEMQFGDHVIFTMCCKEIMIYNDIAVCCQQHPSRRWHFLF